MAQRHLSVDISAHNIKGGESKFSNQREMSAKYVLFILKPTPTDQLTKDLEFFSLTLFLRIFLPLFPLSFSQITSLCLLSLSLYLFLCASFNISLKGQKRYTFEPKVV